MGLWPYLACYIKFIAMKNSTMVKVKVKPRNSVFE